MEYTQKENKIIMSKFDSFDIKEILECGQCFRFDKIDENYYSIVAFNKVLYIKQKEDIVEFEPCSINDFENIWIDYFDLKTDYNEIKNKLSKDDKVMADAINFANGIRILNQQSWECLISFIISQNNRIPMIKQAIKNISQKYGTQLGDYYLFPTIHQIKNADEDGLKNCKTGFRAKYIIDAIENVTNGNINFDNFENMTTEQARENLMSIKGVGPKVADCVLLFSLKRKEVFPTDVWIKRVMQYFYFNREEVSIKKIHEKARQTWGNYAGYAQQYLFYYARDLKIGAK